MNRIQKILYSKEGRIMISLLLGFGLASLFKKACHDRDCLVFYAPPMEKIKDKVFEFNDKCYQFKARGTMCKDGMETIQTKQTTDNDNDNDNN